MKEVRQQIQCGAAHFGRLAAVAMGVIAILTTASASAQSITIGEGIALQWAQFYVADHYHTWEEQGLSPTVSTLASGRLVLDALLGGGVVIGTAAETPVVFAALNGLPVRIVATLNRFEPFDLVAINDIKSAEDLKGRKIGVAQGTNAHYFLSKILHEAGLSSSDITSINLSPADFVSALANGSIDAFVWTAIDKEPQMLVKALRALLAADRMMAKDPEGGSKITADRIELNPSIARAYWPRARFEMALAKDDIVRELQSQAKWAVESKLVRPDVVIPNFQDVVVTKPFADAQGK